MISNPDEDFRLHFEALKGFTPSERNVAGVLLDSLTLKQPDTRLLRRLQQIEKLDSSKKRQVLQMIDTMIEHAQLTQQTTEGSNPNANA